jgi:hypothetical protein
MTPTQKRLLEEFDRKFAKDVSGDGRFYIIAFPKETKRWLQSAFDKIAKEAMGKNKRVWYNRGYSQAVEEIKEWAEKNYIFQTYKFGEEKMKE